MLLSNTVLAAERVAGVASSHRDPWRASRDLRGLSSAVQQWFYRSVGCLIQVKNRKRQALSSSVLCRSLWREDHAIPG